MEDGSERLNKMNELRSFRDLRTYQAAIEAAYEVFVATRSFPGEERWSLTDQIRRSSRAVGPLLAEAWGRRRYRGAFVEKLSQALGETLETQGWLDHSKRCGYLGEDVHRRLDDAFQSIGGMLSRMSERADDFVTPSARVREEPRVEATPDW